MFPTFGAIKDPTKDFLRTIQIIKRIQTINLNYTIMKKVLFVIATLALCMSANAKYWFSGSIGFDNASLYTTTDKAKTLDFSPSFGMALENNIELGIGLGIVDNHYYRADNSVQQAFSFKFAPFIRWTFIQDGNFDMFVQVLRYEREIILSRCLLVRSDHENRIYDVIQKLQQIRSAAARPEAVALPCELRFGGCEKIFQTL